jgi:hypothetical protein
MKAIAKKHFSEFDLDYSVYRSNSMWRVSGTYNTKGQGWKMPVMHDSSLETMIDASRTRFPMPTPEHVSFKPRDINVDKYIAELPDLSQLVSNIDRDFYEDMFPCMKALWALDCPPEGQRHKFLHIMARHCCASGLSEDETVSLFASHKFWSTVRSRDYEKVIASVYRTQRTAIGCKTGSDGDLLRDYCSKLCTIREDFNLGDIIK